MPRRSNNDIADWGRTVADTLSQLGNKSKPSKPKVKMPKAGSSIGFGATNRTMSRIDRSNRQRNVASAQKRRKGTVNRNIR